MGEISTEQVTRFLEGAAEGDAQATAALLPLVYDELRLMARGKMSQERDGHSFSATVLVHEAYLRLLGDGNVRWSSRAQFFFVAAEAMRRILIENARSRKRLKRNDGRQRLPLDVVDLAVEPDSSEIVAVDEAVRRLEEKEPSVAAVVRLRFYAGLSVAEAAKALGVSDRTVYRDWTYARAWLARELGPGQP